MVIYFAALADGKLDKFNIEFTQKSPFFKMVNGGIPKDAFKQYEDFVAYGEFLEEVITDKLPDLLEEAEKLPTKAQRVKEEAGSEIEALDVFKKPQAVVNIASNIAELSKVPELFKQKANQMKKDLEELKDVVHEIKEKINEYEQKAKTAYTDKKCKNAPESYEHSYGPIKYTAAERAKWEKWAAKVCRKNHKSFNPNDYHKNNQTA
jgi:chromosome segregation ATPase